MNFGIFLFDLFTPFVENVIFTITYFTTDSSAVTQPINITTYEYNANHSLKLSKAKQSQANGIAVEKELFLYLTHLK